MYTDRHSIYIFTIMTDVMGDMGASNVSQIQWEAYCYLHITQFNIVSVCAETSL